MTLHSQADLVTTREDLVSFIGNLQRDSEGASGTWENADLARYLEALGAWTADMPGYFEGRGEDMSAVPRWRLFAMMLLAATYYE